MTRLPDDEKPTFDVYRGRDGTLVVHIDTGGVPENEKGPMIRVYLNDDPLFANPDLPPIE